MEYQEFIDDIKTLDFIEDDDAADAAIKAVLGILSSSLEEDKARKITDALPYPLKIETLRRQADINPATYDDCVAQIAKQFQMEDGNARELVDAVLRSTRAALGGQRLSEVEDILPDSWRIAIEDA